MPTPTFQLIRVQELRASTDPAQRTVDGAADDIAELARSIIELGLLEPLLVRPAADAEGEFVVVAGHRRLAALNLLLDQADAGNLTVVLPELEEGVPCLVRPTGEGGRDTAAALVENLQRVNLTPLQEATALRVLRDDHGWTQARIAQTIGRNQGHVSKRLTLLKLTPPLLARVEDGSLTVEVAVDVARLPRAGQDAVLALLEQGRAPDTALRDVRRRFAELSDRTKVVRALAAEEWPALAGARTLDATVEADAAEASRVLTSWMPPGSLVTRPADGHYLPALLDAGVPADQVVLVVLDQPLAYPVGDLDRALAAWTRLFVSPQARDALRERQAAERDATLAAAGLEPDPGAPADRSARSEGLGALIPPRDPATLPTADATDVDAPDARVLVDQLHEPSDTALPFAPEVDVADTLADELDVDVEDLADLPDARYTDDEEFSVLLSAVAAAARDGIHLDVLARWTVWRLVWDDELRFVHPSTGTHDSLASEVLGRTTRVDVHDDPRDVARYAGALALVDLAWCWKILSHNRGLDEPDSGWWLGAYRDAETILRSAGVLLDQPTAALDADQYAPDAQPAQATPAPDAPHQGAEVAPTTPDADDAPARDTTRSEPNAAHGPVDLAGRPRVAELREALLARGVSEYRGAALAGLRRAELEAAADEWNVALAASDAGA